MCCYGILLNTKSCMGAKENQSNLKRKKKYLVDVVVCLQPPALCNTELDTENAAGKNAVLHLSCFSPFPLETVGLEWADACSHPTLPALSNHKTHMVLTHPSTCLPSAPVQTTVPQFI